LGVNKKERTSLSIAANLLPALLEPGAMGIASPYQRSLSLVLRWPLLFANPSVFGMTKILVSAMKSNMLWMIFRLQE